jgi:hypothetical protein
MRTRQVLSSKTETRPSLAAPTAKAESLKTEGPQVYSFLKRALFNPCFFKRADLILYGRAFHVRVKINMFSL